VEQDAVRVPDRHHLAASQEVAVPDGTRPGQPCGSLEVGLGGRLHGGPEIYRSLRLFKNVHHRLVVVAGVVDAMPPFTGSRFGLFVKPKVGGKFSGLIIILARFALSVPCC
jgi:hypothetical protein